NELHCLTGFDTLAEGVFVVVPIRAAAGASSTSTGSHEAALMASDFPKLDASLVNKASFQRSKKIITFPHIESVHQEALIEEEPRHDRSKAFKASGDDFEDIGEYVELSSSALDVLQSDVIEIFKKCRSSSGRFS